MSIENSNPKIVVENLSNFPDQKATTVLREIVVAIISSNCLHFKLEVVRKAIIIGEVVGPKVLDTVPYSFTVVIVVAAAIITIVDL